MAKPFRSGGVLGTSCLPVLGAGSTAASSLIAGNVFLATASPATLMAMKGVGVGFRGHGTHRHRGPGPVHRREYCDHAGSRTGHVLHDHIVDDDVRPIRPPAVIAGQGLQS